MIAQSSSPFPGEATQPCPQHPGPAFCGLSVTEVGVLKTQARRCPSNAGKAPLGTSSHGVRTSHSMCAVHQEKPASQSMASLQTGTDGSGEAKEFLSQGGGSGWE